MMSEKRFERWNDHSCKVKDNYENTLLNWEDVVNKLNELSEENERLRHWNKCLAEKRHNENETKGNLIKKLLSKIDFLERIIDGDL